MNRRDGFLRRCFTLLLVPMILGSVLSLDFGLLISPMRSFLIILNFFLLIHIYHLYIRFFDSSNVFVLTTNIQIEAKSLLSSL